MSNLEAEKTVEQKEQPQANTEEQIDINQYSKRDAREALLRINNIDELNEELLQKTEQYLKNIKAVLSNLKQQYPDDPDLKLLEKLYEDLKEDINKKNEPELNEAFEQILKEIKGEIEKSGVRKEKVINSSLPETVQLLKSANINMPPEYTYIVTKGDKNAKTVVLFLQNHPNPGMTEKQMQMFGVLESQADIEAVLEDAINAGIGKTIYKEGLEYGKELYGFHIDQIKKNNSLDYLKYFATTKIKEKYGPNVNIIGYEDELLLDKIFTSMLNQDREEGQSKYRANAHNTLIASNIADLMKEKNDKIAFAVIGRSHEKKFSSEEKHPMPLSELLAYNGLNVVVFDTSQPIIIDQETKKALEDLPPQIKSAMEKINTPKTE